MTNRRQRVHELVLALLAHQGDLELLHDDVVPGGRGAPTGERDMASWLERNRRIVQTYQAIMRSAVTIDAMVDQELREQHLTEECSTAQDSTSS